MKTYIITMEVTLKDYPSLEDDDFIERGIIALLENEESLDSYQVEELITK